MATTLSVVYRDQIATVLMRLWDSRIPESSNFCAFSWSRGYVQCLADHDKTEMWCEAISARSFEGAWTDAAADGEQVLAELGFRAPDSFSPNYYQFIDIASRETFWQITDTLIAVMERVFHYTGDNGLAFKCWMPGFVS